MSVDWACHSGLEVVLPTGEVIRTGMGAMANSSSWQIFPYGYGPMAEYVCMKFVRYDC